MCCVQTTGELPVAAATAAGAATATAVATTAAATATVATAATAAAAATEPATATGRLGSGFVDGQVTAHEILAVEGCDRSLSLATIWHFHEAEATWAAGLAVHDEGCAGHLAVLGEEVAELVFRSSKREIADVQLHSEVDPALPEGRETVRDSGEQSSVGRKGAPAMQAEHPSPISMPKIGKSC